MYYPRSIGQYNWLTDSRRSLHRILIKDGETVSSAWILLGNTSATTYILIAVVAGIVVIGTVIAGLLTKKKK